MTPVQHLFWQGLEDRHSAEHCRLMRSAALSSAIGTVIGVEPAFQLDYIITMDGNWQFQSLRANGFVNGKEMTLYIEKDAQNEWWRQERRIESLSGCSTIDLSVTPFTNTLAIQTLGLLPGEKKSIRVAYLDIPDGKIYAANQQYHRVGSALYHFSAEPGFEADITVDKDSLVTNYPGLFRQRI